MKVSGSAGQFVTYVLSFENIFSLQFFFFFAVQHLEKVFMCWG